MTTFGDAEKPTTTEALAREQLSAVRLLLSTDRKAEEHDILIATAVEVVSTGSKTTEEIVRFAQLSWPSAGISVLHVQGALETACAAGLMTPTERLDGSKAWELSATAQLESSSSQAWADDALSRFEVVLCGRAREAGLDPSGDEVKTWKSVLLDVLFEGIRTAFATQGPAAAQLQGGRLLVMRMYDLDSMLADLAARVPREDVRSVLQALVLESLDQSSPFGAEIVHYIATGYVLHAFLARWDHPEARATVSLAGEVAILDTPLLVRLLGPGGHRRPIEQSVASARTAGVEVRVYNDTIAELRAVLVRLEHTAREIERRLADGVDAGLLAAMITEEELIAHWLRRHALKELDTWDAFVGDLDRTVTTLKSMGVVVTDEPGFDMAEVGLFHRFDNALRRHIEQRNGGRGDAQIGHDARLLVAAERVRLERAGGGWPGAVVVTFDRVMTPAYRDETATDRQYPVPVTPSQWIGILTAGTEPATTEELAEAVATETAQQTLLSVATRFPVAASLQLVAVLSSTDATTEVDIRLAQLSMDDLLAQQPDIIDNPERAGTQVAGIVVSKRGARTSAAGTAQSQFASRERARAEIQAATAQAEAQAVKKVLGSTTDDLTAERAKSEQLENEKADLEEYARRRPVGWVVAALLVLVAVAGGLFGQWIVFLVSLLTAWLVQAAGEE